MKAGEAFRQHWPEYMIDGALLGLFMISACGFAMLLGHPESPAHVLVGNAGTRQALGGLAMGLTAIALIYSPWGRRSGAHMNPAVTLTFLRRGKVKPWDAFFYVVAQFSGGLTGVLLSKAAFGQALAHPTIRHAATIPGPAGAPVAFLAEVVIACGLMLMVLTVSNTPKVARFTGCFAGLLVALYITFEAPLSGMSMNPARTFASALPGGVWTAIWVYFTAPFVGMFAAAEIYRRVSRKAAAGCAKMHHSSQHRCIFCGQPGLIEPTERVSSRDARLSFWISFPFVPSSPVSRTRTRTKDEHEYKHARKVSEATATH